MVGKATPTELCEIKYVVSVKSAWRDYKKWRTSSRAETKTDMLTATMTIQNAVPFFCVGCGSTPADGFSANATVVDPRVLPMREW